MNVKNCPMKEQIEEKHTLSESIYMSGHGLDWKDSDDIAEQLYTEGYRKQKEGEWIVCGTFDDFLKCSSCGYDRPWQTAIEHKFCPNCGAKMKGGAK